VLVSRARDFLAAGPADAVDLIAHVCQLPRPPRFVADHMAMALLAAWEEFAHDGEGRWSLVSGATGGSWMGGTPALSEVGVGSLDPALQRPLAIRSAPPADRLADLSYVVVDVETTGGSSLGADRITEIAAVVVERGAISRVYETLVNPQRPIPPMVTRLTNITWDMVRHAPPFREIVPQVADAIRGHVFVAHNAGFDWRFSRTRSRGPRRAPRGRRLCMKRRATLPAARRSLPSRATTTRDHGKTRAGGDAVATARVFLYVCEAERGCVTRTDLRALRGAAYAAGVAERDATVHRPRTTA
jgi:DNA polymerase-3 subunit epsilon